MQRIIGTEVEYGISSPSDPTANPILTSTQAVLAYAAAAGIQRAKRTRWDYEVESPLRDARGFDLSRSAGPPPVVVRAGPAPPSTSLSVGGGVQPARPWLIRSP